MKKVIWLVLSLVSFMFISPTALAKDSGQNEDGKILKVIMVLNKNEIDAANLALKKSTNPTVKSFAEMMKTQHSANLRDVKDLSSQIGIKPIASSESADLKAAGKKEGKKLKALKGASFDKAYMDAMYKGHEAALGLIDDKLIPNATNSNLKQFLKATRKVVAMHLSKAKQGLHKI